MVALDQLTKLLVRQLLGEAQERVVIEGFFKFVHWGTGVAWSLFRGNNYLLALVALAALRLVLYFSRTISIPALAWGSLPLVSLSEVSSAT